MCTKDHLNCVPMVIYQILGVPYLLQRSQWMVLCSCLALHGLKMALLTAVGA